MITGSVEEMLIISSGRMLRVNTGSEVIVLVPKVVAALCCWRQRCVKGQITLTAARNNEITKKVKRVVIN